MGIDNTMLPLYGLGVLVTRPKQQAGFLCTWIENNGGFAVCCPTQLICEPRDRGLVSKYFNKLNRYSLVIFTSTNAVAYSLPTIQKIGGIPPLLEIAAIGKATARTLSQFGIDQCLQPPFNSGSEQLLAMPRFQNVRGQSILIIRGEGGRTLLADTLTERGAYVYYAAVYRRECPTVDTSMLMSHWLNGKIGVAVITSIESFINLFNILSPVGRCYLRGTQLILISDRIKQIAHEYGCHRVLVTKEASEDAIKEALLELIV